MRGWSGIRKDLFFKILNVWINLITNDKIIHNVREYPVDTNVNY